MKDILTDKTQSDGPLKRDLFAIIASIAVALPILILWHSKNSEFPHGDAGNYTAVAFQIYKAFGSGILEGLKELYISRTWQTILVPQFAVPAFFFSSGKVLPAMIGYSIAVHSAFAIAIYALSRCFLRRLDSILVVSILLNLPSVLHSSRWLNSEGVFFLFVTCCWAALLRSRAFHERSITVMAGVFLGLASCVRPAESAIILGVPLLVFVAHSIRTGRVHWIDLPYSALPLITLILSVCWNFLRPPSWWGGALLNSLSGALTGWVFYAYLKKFRLKGHPSNLPLFFLTAVTFPCLWFGEDPRELWYWIHHASFQSVVSGNLSARFGFLNETLNLYEKLLGIWGLVTFIAGVFLSCLNPGRNRGLAMALVAVLLGLGVHLGLGAISYNADYRYFIFEMVEVAFLVMAMLLRQPHWKKAIRIYLLGSFIALAAIHLSDLRTLDLPISGFHHAFGIHGEDPPLSEARRRMVYRKILEKLGTRDYPARVLLFYTPPDRSGPEEIFDQFSLTLMEQEENRNNLSFVVPEGSFREWREWNHFKPDLACDFYLIGPVKNESLQRAVERDGHPVEQFQLILGGIPTKFLWVRARETR